MKRISILFLVLSLFFIIGRIIPEWSESYRLFVKETFNNDFYNVYEDSNLGEVYHLQTYHFPNDSLQVFYWRGNSILKSSFKISDENAEKYFQEKSDVADSVDMQFKTLINGNDSLTAIIHTYSSGYRELYLIANAGIILYVYGSSFDIENAIGVCSFLIYGNKEDFAEIPLPEKYQKF